MLSTFFSLFLLAECIFRYTGRYASFNEKNGQPYNSVFNVDGKSWYHVYTPHEVTAQTLAEYSYSIRANNEGLLDKDFDTAKAPHTIRLMIIGDSFIQGMGTSADSTCPRQLESILNKKFAGNPQIEVWNCGVGDSDPFFEYILLKNKLLKYKPDFIIEAINITDVTDLIRRGGAGRFRPDSTLSYPKAPWFEPIYQRSFVARTIVHDMLHYNWLFLRPQQEMTTYIHSVALIDSALTDFQSLCAAEHIPLLVSIQPTRYDFPPTSSPYLMDSVARFCSARGIHTVDVRGYLLRNNWDRERAAQLYWPIDGHFNTLGYQYYAQCLSEPLIQYIASVRGDTDQK